MTIQYPLKTNIPDLDRWKERADTNKYYPNYEAIDQGAIGAFNKTTTKNLVDLIGISREATLIFRHNSLGNTTIYKFLTSETIPSNITVIIENGAILSIALGKTLTINGSSIDYNNDFVSDAAYDESTWNGVTTIAPSKNAVRDEFETKADIPVFTDRGDPVTHDFVVGDFTTDGTWRDLNLSSIVPAGTKAVLLNVIIQDDAVSSIFELREKGNINLYNFFVLRTQVANVHIDGTAIVSCDSNRIIEYFATNLAWIKISITVRGWWK